MNINERINKLRLEKNYSQKELANLCHITEASMSKYLNGAREPRIDVVVNIARALDTTTDYLMGHDSYPKNNSFEELSSLLTRSKIKLTEEQRIDLVNILIRK